MSTPLRTLVPHARTAEWWRGAAIYQIYPRSFADSNGDGIGDLAGITARLDYVAALGVDAIWLSPFFRSPMKDFGYDVEDYCDVDPIFGTLADFVALTARAHALGLRVVIDQVFSHTSDRHAWFRESRGSRDNSKADWYVWADPRADGTPPNNWQSEFGGPAWTWDARRGQYYLHNFLASQPDLNVHHPQVQEALLHCAAFWLERGVDGFRLDAINYTMHDTLLRDNPVAPPPAGRRRTRSVEFQRSIHNRGHADIPAFLERIRSLMDRHGERFTVAEVGGANAETLMHEYTRGDRRLNSAYGFNFLYASQLTPRLVRAALEAWPHAPDFGWPSWAFSNHDAPRAISRWSRDGKHAAMARLAMLLLVSLRGNVFIYQGEELGLPQAHIAFEDLKDPEAIANWPLTLGRDGARTPMPWSASAPHAGFTIGSPWLPVSSEHAALAADRQQGNSQSQLALTRRLLRLRRDHSALRSGDLDFVTSDEQLLVFERRVEDETLRCVFNFSGERAEHASLAGGSWQVLESVNGATLQVLPPGSGLIARRQS